MNIIEERGLKMELSSEKKGVNIVFFLFWTFLYQLLVSFCLFWVDFVPGFGYVGNIHQFWEK